MEPTGTVLPQRGALWGAVLLALVLASCSGPTAPDQEPHFVIRDRDSGIVPTPAMLDTAERLWSEVTACTRRRPEISSFPLYLRGAVFDCGSYPGASGCFYSDHIDARADGFDWILRHEETHLADPGLQHKDAVFKRCAGTPPIDAPPTPLPSLCSNTPNTGTVGLPPCPASGPVP